MASPGQEDATGHGQPPPTSGEPSPRVLAFAPPVRTYRILAVSVALAFGALAAVLWLNTRVSPAAPSGNKDAAATGMRPSGSERSQDAKTAVPAVRNGMVDTSPLRGGGITVREFLSMIEQAAGRPVTCDARAGGLLALRLSNYVGDFQMTPADAAKMLRYAKLFVEQTQDGTMSVRLAGSADRVGEALVAGVDPDGLAWGALRPWRSITISSPNTVQSLVQQCAAGKTEQLPALGLALAVGGVECVWSIGEDGRVNRKQWPQPLPASDIQAARELLARLAGNTNEAETRAAVAADLGDLLRPNSRVQLPANAPELVALGTLLKDADPEVARSAALALGNTASVAALTLLVDRLLEWREKPMQASAALVALINVESLGRTLGRETLGTENWDRRNALFQTVRTFLESVPGTRNGDAAALRYAAAWLRAAEVFAPGAESSGAVPERLWQSGEPLAQLAVLAADKRGNRFSAPDLSAPLQLAVVAGPLWWRAPFTFQRAMVLLDAGTVRTTQAALWRLARPEQRPMAGDCSGAACAALAGRLETIIKDNSSPALRRLALEALYGERQRTGAAGARETFRLSWDAGLALSPFLTDSDDGVQSAAAEILARLATSAQIAMLSQNGLVDRAPQAVAGLLRSLAPRWTASHAEDSELSTALTALADRWTAAADPVVAQQAGWLRLHDPALDLDAKARLASSFKSAAARAGGVRVLSGKKGPLQPKLAAHLLGDSSPAVRAAVFDARLPCLVPADEASKLYAKGLGDTEADVRLAALRALPNAERRPEIVASLKRLAADDPVAAVRTEAAQALRTAPGTKE